MASTKEYLDFVLEQLSELDEVSSRAMMGEYILYYRGKVFGGIYDNRLLVKPVSVAVQLIPDAELELPYDGAKEMILVDDVDNREFLCELVRNMWEELPEKKRKNRGFQRGQRPFWHTTLLAKSSVLYLYEADRIRKW